MRVRTSVSRILLLSSAAAALSAHPAYGSAAAMDAEAAPEPEGNSAQLAEVVVTAQKRAQNVNDVGITIAAVSSGQLRDAGVNDITQLGGTVSGFQVGATPSSNDPSFSIRGVGFFAGQLSAAPAVSVYLDEVPLPYTSMTAGALLDVERVEVLKGPQGTLFGQNATGGAVNFIAAKPTSDFAGGAHLELNNFGQTTVDAFLSGPITDTLRARLSASTTQGGAWQHGYYLDARDIGDQNRTAARLLLDWTPIDALTVSLNLNGNVDRSEAQAPQLLSVQPYVPAAAVPGLIGYPLPTNAREADSVPSLNLHADNSMYQGALRVDYKLAEDLTFTSLSSFVRTTHYSPINLSGTALPVIWRIDTGSISDWTQEFRLAGKIPAANLNYIVGANYEDDSIPELQRTIEPGISALLPNTEMDPDYRVTNRDAAVFGDLDYQIMPAVTLTGGVRYTEYRETKTGCTRDGGSGQFSALQQFTRAAVGLPPSAELVPGGCATLDNVSGSFEPISAHLYQKEHNISWRGGVDFKLTPDMLLYALASRGYKSGTFVVQNILFYSAEQPIKQEELTSYEAGIKADLFDRRLHFNASGYYYDYKNKQFYTYTPQPPFVISLLTNVPKSSVKGFDFDVEAKPVEQVTLRGAVTYSATKIGSFVGYNAGGQPTDFAGSPFDYAPKWSGNLDADYRVPLNDNLSMVIGAGGQFSSVSYADFGEPALLRLPAYNIFNARLGVDAKSWQASFFVRNLANRYYWWNAGTAGDTYVKWAGMPRSFGINASVSF